MNSETRNCQNCKQPFVIESEDFDFYIKIQVPPPTFCPDCRLQRRMAWRNERFLYRVKAANSGKEIFSIYPSDAKAVVYDVEFWQSDGWDQNESGRAYDWNRPFFEQFDDLLHSAPVPSRTVFNLVNSDYANQSGELKNCYLVFGSTYLEDCAYTEQSTRTKDCYDSTSLSDCELCYECFFDQRCYRALYSAFCEDSQDILFCRDCMGCANCIGCVNLRNKSYCIFNQQYTKEDYLKAREEFALHSRRGIETLRDKAYAFWRTNPTRYVRGRHNSDTTGEYISNSKNVHQSYYIDGGENLKFCQFLYGKGSRDSYDHYRPGDNSELIYDAATVGLHASQVMFSDSCTHNCSDIMYSFRCIGSAHLFGCVGLHHKRYCILNRQYSKEEYEALMPRIIEHMRNTSYTSRGAKVYRYGEFFPAELSPYPYNVTVAQEFFPLTRTLAEGSGCRWKDIERKKYTATVSDAELPDSIDDAADSLVGAVVRCENHDRSLPYCPGAFRIIPQEMQFYRRMGIPPPRLCPNCRYAARMLQRNPISLWHRQCMCDRQGHAHTGECSNEFETSYAPDRPEIVYCEQCYNAEVA
jgi:hypothetical protein